MLLGSENCNVVTTTIVTKFFTMSFMMRNLRVSLISNKKHLIQG